MICASTARRDEKPCNCGSPRAQPKTRRQENTDLEALGAALALLARASLKLVPIRDRVWVQTSVARSESA